MRRKRQIAFVLRLTIIAILSSFSWMRLSHANKTTTRPTTFQSSVTNVDALRLVPNELPPIADRDGMNLTQPVVNCTVAAISQFPSDGLTRSNRQHGWIVLHFLVAAYCFWTLTVVCHDYFVPAIEAMSLSCNMRDDVAGATFMAAATSSPELFINSVGTFITEGDLGIGTIVGSSVFNMLAVPACCGLLTGQIIQLDWWPVSRDCVVYALSVLSLIVILNDGKVMWYEALTLVIIYALYINVMFYNEAISIKVRKFVANMGGRKRPQTYREISEFTPLLNHMTKSSHDGVAKTTMTTTATTNGTTMVDITAHRNSSESGCSSWSTQCADDDKSLSIESFDATETAAMVCAPSPWTRGKQHWTVHIMRWPINFLLWHTIPDCRRNAGLKFFTFCMCIVWIGIIAYLVAFVITIIGDTLQIPDSVMGLTFLAAGTSVPEAVASIIVTNQGHGSMGISNSIGSNTFDILICLAVPWLIKSVFLPTIAENHWVNINSSGLSISVGSLLSAVSGLYLALAFNRFKLDWKIGLICTVMYITFLTFANLIEMNVFFPVNSPACEQ